MDKTNVYSGFNLTLIARENVKTTIWTLCTGQETSETIKLTYPRYLFVSDFREKLTKFVFIKGRYFAVSLHEEEQTITQNWHIKHQVKFEAYSRQTS